MADAQKVEDEFTRFRISGLEEFWNPNQDESDRQACDAGSYFAWRRWRTDDITAVPLMCYTDNPSGFKYPKDSLQIASIKIASVRGLQWPIDVFGMVTPRDVLDNRKRNYIYARTRSNFQTITEEHPYLLLSGPTRGVVTCSDPGSIEILLKVKGTTKFGDRDLSFLNLTLQRDGYCSFHGDYTSKLSTLKLGFHHIAHAVEATISARLTGGSLPLPYGFQGVFTASTASIDVAEILLLAFRDGKLPVADDGTIILSRHVVSVGYSRRDQKDQLKVSIVTQCAEDEQNATRDDVVFTPKTYGRSCAVFHVGACKIQVTVAWSTFQDC